jgi:hypothetical protein
MMTTITTSPTQPIPQSYPRRVVDGHKLPDERPPTKNELAWVEMLRAIVGDADPPPSLLAVQALRQALGGS